MTRTVHVPGDAVAVACGADDVAAALRRHADRLGLDVTIVRNGSRGMHWLEPLVEVATAAGRIGYGPVGADDVDGLVAAGLFDGAPHALCIGKPGDHPFLSGQHRMTFARCGIVDPASLDDYVAHGGGAGLLQARALGAAARIEAVKASGLRGRGGAGFPTGIKWGTVPQAEAPRKKVVCNAD
ncbi:MAG: formate dehydrogenase, partial [Sandarakinorhabdus sp.]|nr:formate dehydrogenase [Sandarakinorhabdus sp.]